MGSINEPLWNSFGITHTGNVRTHNEDAYLNFPEQNLWLVADGMGGHSAGDVASHMIVDDLENYTSTPLAGRNVRRINSVLQQVNSKLVALAGADDEEKIIGSTVAVLIIQRHQAICLWAGDSRIYRFRDGTLQQITRDHSELDNLLDSGIALEDAMRSPFAQAITRAVGAYPTLELEKQILQTQKNDVYLLCSDGLNKELTDAEISAVLANHSPEDSVQKLLQIALAKRGQDNVTVMTVYTHT